MQKKKTSWKKQIKEVVQWMRVVASPNATHFYHPQNNYYPYLFETNIAGYARAITSKAALTFELNITITNLQQSKEMPTNSVAFLVVRCGIRGLPASNDKRGTWSWA